MLLLPLKLSVTEYKPNYILCSNRESSYKILNMSDFKILKRSIMFAQFIYLKLIHSHVLCNSDLKAYWLNSCFHGGCVTTAGEFDSSLVQIHTPEHPCSLKCYMYMYIYKFPALLRSWTNGFRLTDDGQLFHSLYSKYLWHPGTYNSAWERTTIQSQQPYTLLIHFIQKFLKLFNIS